MKTSLTENELNLKHSFDFPDENDVMKSSHALLLLPIISYATFKFSLAFPEILWSKATMYYIPAGWTYDEDNSVFDNSVWTWATDYIIAFFMALGSLYCLRCKGSILNSEIRYLMAGLLSLYFASVLSGGICHQYFKTVESMNSISFRLLWFICVGTVSMAGGLIGAIGSNIAKSLNALNVESHFKVTVIPNIFWIGWCVVLTAICASGEMSFKRPPCDIFIAGTTQFVPSAYTILVILCRKWNLLPNINYERKTKFIQKETTLLDRSLICISFVLNAPLLPLYPLLVHQQLSLGLINTLLHTNLLMAWGLQCYSVRRLCFKLAEVEDSVSLKFN